jgi:serine/threonine protein kinase
VTLPSPGCPECGKDVLDIDVKCPHCGAGLAGTGAHKMLGQVMLGQYELVDVLGQGGMSVVFKGKHKMTDQEVALKILPPELAAHSQVKSRFLEEASPRSITRTSSTFITSVPRLVTSCSRCSTWRDGRGSG